MSAITSNTVGLNFMELPSLVKLKLLIGDCGYLVNNDVGVFFDDIGKKMIKALFNERRSIVDNTD